MNRNQLIFGNALRGLRNSKGLTQEQLGERIGVSANAIGRFERGKILPNYFTILSIINTLNVDANLFFAREGVDYPDEAKWIAKIFVNLSTEEKLTVGKFFADIAKVFLASNGAVGEG